MTVNLERFTRFLVIAVFSRVRNQVAACIWSRDKLKCFCSLDVILKLGVKTQKMTKNVAFSVLLQAV